MYPNLNYELLLTRWKQLSWARPTLTHKCDPCWRMLLPQRYLGSMVAGAAAGTASSLIRVPTEVIKQRLQTGEFTSAVAAVSPIVRTSMHVNHVIARSVLTSQHVHVHVYASWFMPPAFASYSALRVVLCLASQV